MLGADAGMRGQIAPRQNLRQRLRFGGHVRSGFGDDFRFAAGAGGFQKNARLRVNGKMAAGVCLFTRVVIKQVRVGEGGIIGNP